MQYKSVIEILGAIKKKDISSSELTRYYLNQIKEKDADLNCFITVTEEAAISKAQEIDNEISKGVIKPLSGLPIAQKDIFCTKGIKTSCGSKMLDNFISPYDATVIEKLNNAGTIMLGKTNMDEFAMGSSNETSFYGPVKNPWDKDYVPGGSSGGSASAVAARIVPCSTGTDTGGSIRQPASLCGICGLKPTYGRVSRYGMIAFASSLDQAGLFTTDALDAAVLLKEISGHDPKDSTSSNVDVPDYYNYCINNDKKAFTIGIPDEFINDLNEDVKKSFYDAVKILEGIGCKIKKIKLEHTGLGVSAYQVVAPAECSSNLSRFDGVRFGHRSDKASTLEELYRESRSEGFGKEVKRRILVGTYALSAGYYDAYYLKAQKVRNLITQDFNNAFNDVDLILGPTTPDKAFKIGEKMNDPIAMYLSDVYTVSTNLAGLPAMSIPMGFKDKLPLGLQIIGNHFDEKNILKLCHLYQKETDWHIQEPNC
ncbi:MAG: Asp-tRNA(Asn)/Glu-tRNA(Gln) amidotransferase subunit GatA [Gammaproteobacteria bacterium]|nr:Asp-tRNA(Asn)/Glu-tRNA(Gln) amidotransferase subunit GatA [Gammaproteobacteria bacterium]MBL6819448.1 Asp-tRNA(Asn)/Glu-tRNA(Gln) amidotransferase subunit GatA [Gammaproteobacteria bacterium]MBL6899066.1 Asp-tRNA(Asn)/Glu-tRNA(Gln) amidotransferase subunit GatA [Gammaproteobacteria bacterium]